MRRLFTILSALSLLLFISVVVLWVRSYWQEYWVGGVTTKQTPGLYHESLSIGCARGLLIFHRLSGVAVEDRHWVFYSFPAEAFRADSDYARGMFGFRIYHSPFAQTIVHIPMWSLLAIMLAIPIWHLRKEWAARLSRPRGHCRHCGYDLRATPERCPECGQAVPAADQPLATVRR